MGKIGEKPSISKNLSTKLDRTAFVEKDKKLSSYFKEVDPINFYRDMFFNGEYFQLNGEDTAEKGNLIFLVQNNSIEHFITNTCKVNVFRSVKDVKKVIHKLIKYRDSVGCGAKDKGTPHERRMLGYWIKQYLNELEKLKNNFEKPTSIYDLKIYENKNYKCWADMKPLWEYLNIASGCYTKAIREGVFGAELKKQQDFADQFMTGVVDKKTGKIKKIYHNCPWYEADNTLEDKTELTILVPPYSSFGGDRKEKNICELFALVVDLDGVTPSNLQVMINCINIGDKMGRIFRPTYIVNSGHGLHLYYMFNEPIPLYDTRRKRLDIIKKMLIEDLWEPDFCEYYDSPQISGVSQNFRAVGSKSKLGKGYNLKAYKVGDKINLIDLIKWLKNKKYYTKREQKEWEDMFGDDIEAFFLPPKSEYKRGTHVEKPKSNKIPIFYQNRAMYDNVIRLANEAGKNGHRYHIIQNLASVAVKCGVSREELYEDARKLQEMLDKKWCKSEQGHFTWAEAKKALKIYDNPREVKEYKLSVARERTKLPYKEVKHNGGVSPRRYERNKEYYDSQDPPIEPWATRKEHGKYRYDEKLKKIVKGKAIDTRFTSENASEMGKKGGLSGSKEKKAENGRKGGKVSKRKPDDMKFTLYKTLVKNKPDMAVKDIALLLGCSPSTIYKYRNRS